MTSESSSTNNVDDSFYDKPGFFFVLLFKLSIIDV